MQQCFCRIPWPQSLSAAISNIKKDNIPNRAYSENPSKSTIYDQTSEMINYYAASLHKPQCYCLPSVGVIICLHTHYIHTVTHRQHLFRKFESSVYLSIFWMHSMHNSVSKQAKNFHFEHDEIFGNHRLDPQRKTCHPNMAKHTLHPFRGAGGPDTRLPVFRFGRLAWRGSWNNQPVSLSAL